MVCMQAGKSDHKLKANGWRRISITAQKTLTCMHACMHASIAHKLCGTTRHAAQHRAQHASLTAAGNCPPCALVLALCWRTARHCCLLLVASAAAMCGGRDNGSIVMHTSHSVCA
jgi:hypothetical protein